MHFEVALHRSRRLRDKSSKWSIRFGINSTKHLSTQDRFAVAATRTEQGLLPAISFSDADFFSRKLLQPKCTSVANAETADSYRRAGLKLAIDPQKTREKLMRMLSILMLLVISLTVVAGCASQPTNEPTTLGEWGRMQRPKL